MAKQPGATTAEMIPIADKLAKDEIPIAVKATGSIAGIVEKGAEMSDPIYQLIKQGLTPANIGVVVGAAAPILTATGAATGVIINATGNLVDKVGNIIGKISSNATHILTSTGKEIGSIAKETVKSLATAFTTAGVALIGAWSTVATKFMSEVGESYRTTVSEAGNTVRTVVDKHYETETLKNKEKFIKSIVIICAIVVVIIIIIVVIAVTSSPPKKMTNGSIVHFEPNYNPEKQSSFDEKCYKYYDKLMI